jgi:putative transcriptional regulator
MAGELRVEAGTLLAAFPDMLDPNFMHSVVLICQHSDQGAYGVITNRATPQVVKELLPDHPTLGRSSFPVFLGGPVDHSTLQFVHVVPEVIPGGMSIDGKLWLGGDLDALGEYLVKKPRAAARRVRLFRGYSGWSAGQLDGELGSGSWLPAPPALRAIFGEPGETTWRRVVRSIGGEGEGLDRQPPDVSWN